MTWKTNNKNDIILIKIISGKAIEVRTSIMLTCTNHTDTHTDIHLGIHIFILNN